MLFWTFPRHELAALRIKYHTSQTPPRTFFYKLLHKYIWDHSKSWIFASSRGKIMSKKWIFTLKNYQNIHWHGKVHIWTELKIIILGYEQVSLGPTRRCPWYPRGHSISLCFCPYFCPFCPFCPYFRRAKGQSAKGQKGQKGQKRQKGKMAKGQIRRTNHFEKTL